MADQEQSITGGAAGGMATARVGGPTRHGHPRLQLPRRAAQQRRRTAGIPASPIAVRIAIRGAFEDDRSRQEAMALVTPGHRAPGCARALALEG